MFVNDVDVVADGKEAINNAEEMIETHNMLCSAAEGRV